VDLGFAGRYPSDHKVHRAIARLSPGDKLELRQRDGRWELFHEDDLVGRLASAYRLPANMRCRGASVAAVLTRFAEDSKPEYRDRLKSRRWEVVVPELVFDPIAPAGPPDDDGDPWATSAVASDRERRVADR